MTAKQPAPPAPTTVSLDDEGAPQAQARERVQSIGIRVELPHCVDNAEEAIAIVREHHARWQSSGSGPA